MSSKYLKSIFVFVAALIVSSSAKLQAQALSLSTSGQMNIACHGDSTGSISLAAAGGISPYQFILDKDTQNNGLFSGLKAGAYKAYLLDSAGDLDSLLFTITQPTALQININLTAPSCAYRQDGALEVSVTGGTTPYTYRWNDNQGWSSTNKKIEYLLHGSYKITVSDSQSCGIDSTVNLVHSDSLEVFILKTDISCNGLTDGEATANITSNGSAYVYDWSGPNAFNASSSSINGLASGNYQLKVTETTSSCTATASVTIIEPIKLNTAITQTKDARCSGSADGELYTSTTGGRAPYTYLWSGPNSYFSSNRNIVNAKAGSYTLTISDSTGCLAYDTNQISEPAALSVIPKITNMICYGYPIGEIDLTVNGGTKPYKYTWSTGDTKQDLDSLNAGVYSVTIIDSQACSFNGTYGISTPTQLVLSYNSSNVRCNGGDDGSLILLASGGTYPWSYEITGPNSFSSSNVSNKSLKAGSYKIILTDNNDCKDSTSVSIQEPANLSVTNKVTLPECNGQKGSFSLTVSGGTTPYGFEWLDGAGGLYAATQNVVSVDVGSYTYTVTDGNQCSYSDTNSIYEPPKLELTTSKVTPNICINDKNGGVDLTASGGTKPYTYRLNSGTFQTSATFGSLAVGRFTALVQDKNACSDTTVFNVDYVDTVKPIVKLKPITRYLNNAGKARITLTDIDNGIMDNCEIQKTSVSQTEFDCSNLGNNNVTVTVYDLKGNLQQKDVVVTILDTVSPIIKTQPISVYLNQSGKATINPNSLNKSSSDNCGIQSFTASQTTFDCSNLGSNSINVTASDASANKTTKKEVVNVQDTIKPNLRYKNIVIYLNSSGSVTITPSDVDDGSNDNCGITSYEVSQSSFDCNNIGTNFIDFSVQDATRNKVTQSVRVTVRDTFAPVIKIKPVTLFLNQYGFAVLSPNDVDDGSVDNCSISNRSLAQSVFTCGNIGTNNVGFSITDNSGNKASVNVNITVKDTTSPINKVRNPPVYLNQSGFAILSSFDVDNGSSDNCGVSKVTLSKDRFNCVDLGKNVVDFTTYDASGNKTVSPITVTVLDTVKPLLRALSKPIYLNSTGQQTIPADFFDDGSTDNCKIQTRTLSQYNFNCSDVGNKLILYTVADTSGNSTLTVISTQVLDTISPKLYTQNQTVYLDSLGEASISVSLFSDSCSDNCRITSLNYSDSMFNCSNLGTNVVQLMATDPSGNANGKPFLVEVFDTVAPIIKPKSVVIYIDTAGKAFLAADQVVESIYDNCGIQKILLNKYVYEVADIGDNFVEITAYDNSGNRSLIYQASVRVEVGDFDHDSIPDYVERELDFDNDGVANYRDRDSDNDGILDVHENSGLTVLLDLDRDGLMNVYDLDTDGDGIKDIFEVNGFDPDRNGAVGIGRVVVDYWGIPVLANDGQAYDELDTDLDNVPDYKDLDSDDDKIEDQIENLGKSELVDSDEDGFANIRDLDSDEDGISDLIETAVDFDQDGTGNFLDLDSDADQIIDKTETASDEDSDGIGNWLDLDSDNDDLLDILEGQVDSDKDGKGNWLDNDADNDGISDKIESNEDTDLDGILDYLDIDSDNDFIFDAIEAIPFVNDLPADTDLDGRFDYLDDDSDNDLISDFLEGYPNQPDTDEDGTPDYRDTDSDGDGVLDILEGTKDTDGDGIMDSIDEDSDNDGIPDLIETNQDIDGDGVPNSLDLDSDNDGINDVWEAGGNDTSGRGMLYSGVLLTPPDTDGDGVMNPYDLDSDGDGISDMFESFVPFKDRNFDDRHDGGDIDGDGIVDPVDYWNGVFGDYWDYSPYDFDYDGIPDYVDLDSDNDSIPDAIEGADDEDFDFFPNNIDEDSDADSIFDITETALDPDNDGIPNFLDLDSDGDHIDDYVELDGDFDQDGIMNFLDLDSDDDEMPDSEEGIIDKEGNGLMDFIDPHTFVPEIFTPNDDGINDVLFIKGLKNYPDASINVFNQWGQVVYRSNGPYKNNWRGTNTEGSGFKRGVKLSEGVYFFVLEHNRNDMPRYIKPSKKGNIFIKP